MGALTERFVADVVDFAGDEPSGHAWGESSTFEVVPDGVFHDGDRAARVARVGTTMLVSVAFHAIVLNWRPSQSAVTPLIATLPPTVLPLIDHGMSPPPPVSVMLPPTVNCRSSTVFAAVALTFPFTVMTVCVCRRLARDSSEHADGVRRLAAHAQQ